MLYWAHPAFLAAAENADFSPTVRILGLLGIGSFFGTLDAILADKKGLNPLFWFLVGFIPIIGMIAMVFYLISLPDRRLLPANSAIPRGRIVMAGVRGIFAGVFLVGVLYCALVLVLVLAIFDLKVFDVAFTGNVLYGFFAVVVVVSAGFCIWAVRRAARGRDPEITEKTPLTVPTATPETDLGKFDHREEFRPLAETYRRQQGKLVFGLMCCLVVSSCLPGSCPGWIRMILFFAGGLVIMSRLAPRLPDCPACGHFIGKIDRYCPGCGSTLIREDPSKGPRCQACDKILSQGKGRNFKYRVCSHCGAVLDVQGL